ncbi:MAG: ShlB/FhaC/HecB family hemolysin secretion/activation protein [Phycisphaerales bacterium]|nr:ShlB/FhaC/HecB family hemolysin secretion/activation protein [Phycisphaerales bacterium]
MKVEPTRAVGALGIGAAAWISATVGLAPPLWARAAAQPESVPGQPPIELPETKPRVPPPPPEEQPAPAPAPTPAGPAPGPAAAPALEPGQTDHGERYAVSRFVLEYGREAPNLPAIDELYDLTVDLAKDGTGYMDTTGAPPGAKAVRVRIGDVFEGDGAYFYASGVRKVTTAIVERLQKRGLVGLFVTPHPDDVDESSGADLREGRAVMRLQIWVAVVKEIRSIASGERVPADQRIDSPLHERIREGSVARKDELLTRGAIDDYVFRLNRHPGRRVDVAVSAYGEQTGDVMLDYLVSENKPWSVYGQVSNTGTRSTDEWRERLGFVHNQLTGNDDILRLDYLTSTFSGTDAVVGSYEFPVYSDRLRLRPFGSYSQFQASDLGIRDENFAGTTAIGGADVAWNVAQFGPSFIDLIGGARWENVKVLDLGQGSKGVDNFFLPSVGARFTRDTDDMSSYASVSFESTLSGVSNTDPDELAQLGRRGADKDWVVLKWDAGHQFYLEPLFNRAAWRGETGKGATLAHEVAFLARGQWAYHNDRLIPQAEDVAGGFYTVRGYPESVVAGDTVYIVSAEYRLHIPRLLGIPGTEEERTANRSTFFGEQFRWRPEQPFGRPDWDLIFRTFVDAGRVEQSKKISGEHNDSLVGTGFGLELQVRRNLFIRSDVGWVLDEISDPDTTVSVGSSRLHFSATFVY